jgi:preprotein translocase subunit SecG
LPVILYIVELWETIEMTNFIGIIHIVVAIALIILVLIQDSKSDGALGMGGSSGSNSLLGATGAQTLAGKMTVWTAVIFASI